MGFLPVLPGPCAFFRRAEIEGAPLHEYFDMGYKPPQELGLLQSNLKISEDRIPSWSAVWIGRHAQYSAWHTCLFRVGVRGHFGFHTILNEDKSFRHF